MWIRVLTEIRLANSEWWAHESPAGIQSWQELNPEPSGTKAPPCLLRQNLVLRIWLPIWHQWILFTRNKIPPDRIRTSDLEISACTTVSRSTNWATGGCYNTYASLLYYISVPQKKQKHNGKQKLYVIYNTKRSRVLIRREVRGPELEELAGRAQSIKRKAQSIWPTAVVAHGTL